jgi:pimeloyl-ACP methyl ester carboxylesterase
MTRPGIVLVHGGSHTGECWRPTVEELHLNDAGLPVLAVDLPGHGGTPGDLRTLTIAQCVDSVVAQIDAAGIDEVVLVGHSMAGITIPGVATKLGPDRLRRLVFLSTCVPPNGKTILDTTAQPIRSVVTFLARNDKPAKPMPRPMASFFFCNGMTRAQKAFSLSGLVPESSAVSKETVHREPLPAGVPTTWIISTKDHSLPPKQQRRFIENLGGVDEVLEIEACHNAMIAAPEKLARILLDRTPVTSAR